MLVFVVSACLLVSERLRTSLYGTGMPLPRSILSSPARLTILEQILGDAENMVKLLTGCRVFEADLEAMIRRSIEKVNVSTSGS